MRPPVWSWRRPACRANRSESIAASAEQIEVVSYQGMARLASFIHQRLRRTGNRPAIHRRVGRTLQRGDAASLPTSLSERASDSDQSRLLLSSRDVPIDVLFPRSPATYRCEGRYDLSAIALRGGIVRVPRG